MCHYQGLRRSCQGVGWPVREGSQSWNGRTFTPQSYGKSGKGYGGSKGSQSGKGSYKTAYNAYPDEEGYGEYDEEQEEYYEEDAPYVGLLGGIEEHIAEQHASHADNPPEAYDLHDEIDEYEANNPKCPYGFRRRGDRRRQKHWGSYPAPTCCFRSLRTCERKR